MPGSDLNPFELQSIRGFPDTLKIYRIKRSKFWQCRYFVAGRGLIRKSTRCTEKAEATDFAKDFYETILLERRSGRLTSQSSFAQYAEQLLERQKSMVARGELNLRMVAEDRGKLRTDVLPKFGELHIGKITTSMVRDYIDDISAERNLSPSTLKKHVVLIRKVFRTAVEDNALDRIPIMPVIKRKDQPRTWFDDKEYKLLRDTCRSMAEKDKDSLIGRDYSKRNRF
jgi:hypothetical protein